MAHAVRKILEPGLYRGAGQSGGAMVALILRTASNREEPGVTDPARHDRLPKKSYKD